jgi:glycine cleavage system H protein
MSTYYTKDHEWIRVEGDNAWIGITAHAAEQLGDVVFVEVGEVGSTIKQGEALGTIESVKAASDIFAPVDGEIVEVNARIGDNPALVNESPEQDGWLCRVTLANQAQLHDLMDKPAYDAFVA